MTKASPKRQAIKKSTKAEISSEGADRLAATKALKSSRANSKSASLIVMLSNKRGASLVQLQKAGGWQTHSVRGFLSGTVKKRLGLPLRSFKTKDGERRYTTVGS